MLINTTTTMHIAEPAQPAPSVARTPLLDERPVPKPRNVTNAPARSGATAYARAGTASNQANREPYCFTYLSSVAASSLSRDAFNALKASAPKNVNGPSIVTSVPLRKTPETPSNTLVF
jgi:hypothetical protein